MSELIENTKIRRNVLKHLILQLHEGKTCGEMVSPSCLSGLVPANSSKTGKVSG